MGPRPRAAGAAARARSAPTCRRRSSRWRTSPTPSRRRSARAEAYQTLGRAGDLRRRRPLPRLSRGAAGAVTRDRVAPDRGRRRRCSALLAWGVTRGPRTAGHARARRQRAERRRRRRRRRGVPHITATLFYATPRRPGARAGPARGAARRRASCAQGRADPRRAAAAARRRRTSRSIPTGTTLRAFYVTERGDAFVDLSARGLARTIPAGRSPSC